MKAILIKHFPTLLFDVTSHIIYIILSIYLLHRPQKSICIWIKYRLSSGCGTSISVYRFPHKNIIEMYLRTYIDPLNLLSTSVKTLIADLIYIWHSTNVRIFQNRYLSGTLICYSIEYTFCGTFWVCTTALKTRIKSELKKS